MIKQIAIINKSTVVTNADVTSMANVCNTQITRDVAPAWGRSPIPVAFYSNENLVPSTAAKIYIFDNADQAGALGYHTETMSGVVFGKVFAKTIKDYGLPTLYKANAQKSITISSVLSHEVIELFVNPYVNLWSDGPQISQGNEYSYEACDAVEGDVYQITITAKPSNIIVSVSNFLYPEYFDTASPSTVKLDYLGLIKTPFTMTSNGYMVVRSTSGNETAIYGATYPRILKNIK